MLSYNDLYRHRGRFTVPLKVVKQYPEKVIALLEGHLIMRAEVRDFGYDVEYESMSVYFAAVPDGDKMPTYEVVQRMRRLGNGDHVLDYLAIGEAVK